MTRADLGQKEAKMEAQREQQLRRRTGSQIRSTEKIEKTASIMRSHGLPFSAR
jgi:hypothetical protein